MLLLKKKERILRNSIQIDNKINEKKICEKSEAMTNQIKRELFNHIFDLIKNKEQEKILGNDVDIEILPDFMKIFISTLIKELQEQNENLSREDFLAACEEIYKVMIFQLIFRYQTRIPKVLCFQDTQKMKGELQSHQKQ